jgi:hypothetical protein
VQFDAVKTGISRIAGRLAVLLDRSAYVVGPHFARHIMGLHTGRVGPDLPPCLKHGWSYRLDADGFDVSAADTTCVHQLEDN